MSPLRNQPIGMMGELGKPKGGACQSLYWPRRRRGPDGGVIRPVGSEFDPKLSLPCRPTCCGLPTRSNRPDKGAAPPPISALIRRKLMTSMSRCLRAPIYTTPLRQLAAIGGGQCTMMRGLTIRTLSLRRPRTSYLCGRSQPHEASATRKLESYASVAGRRHHAERISFFAASNGLATVWD